MHILARPQIERTAIEAEIDALLVDHLHLSVQRNSLPADAPQRTHLTSLMQRAERRLEQLCRYADADVTVPRGFDDAELEGIPCAS